MYYGTGKEIFSEKRKAGKELDERYSTKIGCRRDTCIIKPHLNAEGGGGVDDVVHRWLQNFPQLGKISMLLGNIRKERSQYPWWMEKPRYSMYEVSHEVPT